MKISHYLNIPKQGSPFITTKPKFNKVTLDKALANLKEGKRSSFGVIDVAWLEFQKNNNYLLGFIKKRHQVDIEEDFFLSSISNFVDVYKRELPF